MDRRFNISIPLAIFLILTLLYLFSGNMRNGLTIVVVGGMLIGTAIILLVMPLLFRFVQTGKK